MDMADRAQMQEAEDVLIPELWEIKDLIHEQDPELIKEVNLDLEAEQEETVEEKWMVTKWTMVEDIQINNKWWANKTCLDKDQTLWCPLEANKCPVKIGVNKTQEIIIMEADNKMFIVSSNNCNLLLEIKTWVIRIKI